MPQPQGAAWRQMGASEQEYWIVECTPLFGEKLHMWAIIAPVLRFLHWAI